MRNWRIITVLLVISVAILSILAGCSSQQTTSAQDKKENHKAHAVAATAPMSQEQNSHPNKVVYLTFDDGPGEYTSQVLDILNQYHIKATFFVLGPHAEKYKNLVQQEVQEGDYVGMHSMTHDYKKLYVQGNFVPEMKEDQQIIKQITGTEPNLARPPYGSMPGLNQQLRDQVAAAGFKIWDWTIDSLDWKYNKVPFDKSVPAIVHNVLSHANGNREVVLMHDIHPQSVQALPTIIQGLKEKGYAFEAYNEEEHFSLNFWHDNRL
ncbi:polysaccharide deacetylase family protein [Ectobacillus panaciterrae]|uniref:polysaccharide deacetylase family protein n=1 Tax=Ectobacillus panaciterrae TaxID=363872 RepID=UPI000427D228|nr:polysaccharide deacetylase family protein [Ectobacillus panaciterrae]